MRKAPEMYPIESWISKSLDRVTAISDSDPTLYEPTKERYRLIASNCLAIVNVISSMLEEDLISCTSIEDDPILHIYETVDKLAESISKDSRSSIAHSKLAKSSYKDCIKRLAEKSFTNADVNGCSQFLYEWFNNRFCSYADGVRFRYDILKVPEWIAGMTLLYCKHLVQHTLDSLETTMAKWYKDIRDPDNKCSTFAIPYEAFQLLSGKDTSIYLDSLVMWDILLDEGLSSSCSMLPCEYQIQPKLMLNIASQLNLDSLLNSYSDYTLDPSVLDRCFQLKGDGLI